ncbi:hypothetical protein [Natrinema sp. SYSU A 869]|nr:hypothetical protein [Natrinema sp. SYSU A 869]
MTEAIDCLCRRRHVGDDGLREERIVEPRRFEMITVKADGPRE